MVDVIVMVRVGGVETNNDIFFSFSFMSSMYRPGNGLLYDKKVSQKFLPENLSEGDMEEEGSCVN